MKALFNILAEGVRCHIDIMQVTANRLITVAPHLATLFREAAEGLVASEFGVSLKELRAAEKALEAQIGSALMPVIGAVQEFKAAWGTVTQQDSYRYEELSRHEAQA